MSLDSRLFDDAARVLARWEQSVGPSPESRQFRERLTRERVTPRPASFIPLEFPAQRPTAQQAAAFVGHWVTVAQPATPHAAIRVSRGTTLVPDRAQHAGI